MPFRTSKLLRGLLFISLLGFSFAWLGCPTDVNSNPPPPTKISPPRSPKLILKAIAGGGTSYANISWLASKDTANSTFFGYRIITNELDSNGNILRVFQVQSVDKSTLSYKVDSLILGSRYITSIQAELTDGTSSDTVSTPVYGAVYYNTDGRIDEFATGSESGFGWPYGATDDGFEYSYTTANANAIDLHLRRNGTLSFYSPKVYPPGVRVTKLEVVGADSTAFNKTSLNEPDKDSIASVAEGNVYLLKTASNYYVKVYVKNINNSVSPNYKTLYFEYKVQSVPGLRIL